MTDFTLPARPTAAIEGADGRYLVGQNSGVYTEKKSASFLKKRSKKLLFI